MRNMQNMVRKSKRRRLETKRKEQRLISDDFVIYELIIVMI